MNQPLRPQRADGAATRARILETAGEMIAKQGFAKTTNKAIAAAAEVDLASINYHFGSRDGLYQAVLTYAHDRIVSLDELMAVSQSSQLPEQKLHQLMAQIIDAALTPHWSQQLISQAVLMSDNAAKDKLDKIVIPKMDYAVALLSQISNLPPEHPRLKHCLFSVMSPIMVLLLLGKRMPEPICHLADDKTALTEHLYQAALAILGRGEKA